MATQDNEVPDEEIDRRIREAKRIREQIIKDAGRHVPLVELGRMTHIVELIGWIADHTFVDGEDDTFRENFVRCALGELCREEPRSWPHDLTYQFVHEATNGHLQSDEEERATQEILHGHREILRQLKHAA